MNFYDKGNRVVSTQEGRHYYGRVGKEFIKEGTPGVVTSAERHGAVSVQFYPKSRYYVVTVPVEDLAPEDPNAPRPRQLGEVPEGMISPDDPRLDWLWRDAAALAERKQYCSEFDTLTATLGIPGRERDFTVTTQVNGFDAKVKVKARSQREAERMVLGDS